MSCSTCFFTMPKSENGSKNAQNEEEKKIKKIYEPQQSSPSIKDAHNEERKQNKKMYKLQQSSPYKNIESSPDSLESGRH